MGTHFHQHATVQDSLSAGQAQLTATTNPEHPSSPAPNTRRPGTSPPVHPDRVTDVPPFWSRNRHTRSVSSASYQSFKTGAILLEDHSDDRDEHARCCWAESVSIDDYTVVSGPSGIGAYVVWHCTVTTLSGGSLSINKRYSEFDRLRQLLVHAFPHADAMIPHLPRKSVVSRFRPRFLEQRKAGLAHFMNCILLNPEFASSPILKEFIFNG